MIVKALDKHQDRVASWIARGREGHEPWCPERDALELRGKELNDKGIADLDIDLALYAIRSYATRNSIFHGQIFDLDQSQNFAGLAECIAADEKHLEYVVPDGDQPMVGKWRRILTLYRDLHIRKDGNGDWIGQDPLSEQSESSTVPPIRMRRAELRCQIDAGQLRASHSPDGPPRSNVKFTPESFRRRSDPTNRGTKRRAMDPSPE